MPLFDERLAENKTVTISKGENIVELDNYYYAVQLKAQYKDLLNNIFPIAFSWKIEGVMLPDKETEAGNLIYGGTAYDNYTVIIPAGYYNVTFKSNILGFEKSDTKQVSLLDNNYYKFITFVATLTSTEIEEGNATSAILQVIVQDQYSQKVDNAVIKVYDNNLLIANQKTVRGVAIIGGLEIGKTYTVEVWFADKKKAEKAVTINDAATTILFTIHISEDEIITTTVTPPPPPGDGGGEGGEEVAQNILAAVVGNYAFWGFLLLCVLSVAAASSAGERIGLIVFVGGLGVLTFVIPLLPTAIFMIVAIVAGILFTWKVMDKIMGNRGD